ncbi:hypothetical protein M153_900002776 [Pseudoloma neurophilia]|uniref:Uncharacterized protein n=1 Tax=Pseudoloma neurophilia TaxID=146866 RepID=A0A0R0M0B6_9MICR|nr:hypothetical protein M153_900002776 [Pseudoloma neurophilia]
MKKPFYKSRFFARRPPNVYEETVFYIERYLRDNRLPTKRGNIFDAYFKICSFERI